MRHVRMLGLCLAAVCAIFAVAASGASALPEWGRCEEKAGGSYSDANCTKKVALGKGNFVFKKGKELAPDHFSGANVGTGGVLTTSLRTCLVPEKGFVRTTRANCAAMGGEEKIEGTLEVECESEHNTGEAVGTNEVRGVTVKFLGCKGSGVPCSNGPNTGEINVNPLKGKLGYIKKSTKEVGVLLEPVVKHGEFAKFDCGGILETAVGVGNSKTGAFYQPETTGGYDGIISPITPVNTTTTEYTQVFTINHETVENIPNKFEGKHIDELESYLFGVELPEHESQWSAAGEEITNVNHSEEAGEIKA